MRVKNFISKATTYFHDARHFQIAYLGSFLLIGIFILGWHQYLSYYLLTISTAILTQAIGAKLTHKKDLSLKSALITS